MLTPKELLKELNSISVKMNETLDDEEARDLYIDKLINIIKTNPIKDNVFEELICDIMKSYNIECNTALYLRQQKKYMSNAYNTQDKEKAKEIINDVLKYQQDNKLNFLETKIINDIKFYLKYIDVDYYNEIISK